MNEEEWIENLKEQNDSETATWILEHREVAEKEKVRFWQDFTSGKLILTARGFYGPDNGEQPNDAYLDEVINPEEGGTYLKVYGCPVLQKGCCSLPVVRAIRIPKYLIAGLPKDIARFSKLSLFFIGFLWIFNRQGLLKIVREILAQIDYKVVSIVETWPEKSYNAMEGEIYRALIESGRGEGVLEDITKLFARLIRLIFFNENTYKSRIQDAFGEADNFWQALDILRDREVKESGSTQKTWILTKLGLRFAALTSPQFKRIINKFFNELDRDKIKMDKDDWFYCLTYRSYNFKGWSYELRNAERKRLNKKYKVVFLKSDEQRPPD